jgi:hypothetical protein
MNAQEAIDAWTELERRVSVGAYEERSAYDWQNGTWPADGVEESIANLETWAEKQGLEFCWNIDSKTWSLYPIEPTLMPCSCGGAHYVGQRCPLSPQGQAAQAYEDTRTYMEHHYLGGE